MKKIFLAVIFSVVGIQVTDASEQVKRIVLVVKQLSAMVSQQRQGSYAPQLSQSMRVSAERDRKLHEQLERDLQQLQQQEALLQAERDRQEILQLREQAERDRQAALRLQQQREAKSGLAKSMPVLTECKICGDPKRSDELAVLACGHENFCKACLADMIAIAINEKNLEQVRCPACKKPFGQSDIKNIAGWLAAHEIGKIKIEKAPGFRHCPTLDCSQTFMVDKANPTAEITCRECGETYCSNCLLPHDVTKSCEQAKAEDIGGDIKALGVKPCPNCENPIEKNLGCNRMTCASCKEKFCWDCLGSLESGIEHVCTAAAPGLV